MFRKVSSFRGLMFLGLLCFAEWILFFRLDLMAFLMNVEQFQNHETVKDNQSALLVIDVVSISSVKLAELPEAQATTWASHKSVRNFRVVTEQDDADPHCALNITRDHVKAHSEMCQRKHRRHMFLRKHIFGRWQWLFKKSNPMGWLCAQKRPANGLGLMGDFYRSQHWEQGIADVGGILPDYLLLVDDDTYFNLELFHEEMAGLDPADPVVYAGCLVRDQSTNNTIMFGGYGTIFSMGAISRLIRPVYCESNVTYFTALNTKEVRDEDFQGSVCARLSENLFGEGVLHSPGMSISDLMRSFANRPDAPYCHHSDWALADFVNYYFLSNRAWYDIPGDGRDYMRLHSYASSEIWARSMTGNCLNNHEDICRSNTSHVCHYMSSQRMANVTEEFKASLLMRATGDSEWDRFKGEPTEIMK